MSNKVIERLLSHEGQHIKDGSDMQWLFTGQFDFRSGKRSLGLTLDGWAIDAEGSTTVLNNEKSFLAALVLLEKDFKVVYDAVTGFLRGHQLDSEAQAAFPFHLLIEFGLKSHSDYWPELARKWFDEAPSEIKGKLIPTLNELLKQNQGSQRFRHWLRKNTKQRS